MVYLPISTAQAAFGGHDRVQQVLFTVGDASVEDSVRIEEQVRALFAARRRFDPSDPRAIRIRNNVESFAQIQRVLSLLRAFVWVVGLGTMTAGLVGVSNILLVSVRERLSLVVLVAVLLLSLVLLSVLVRVWLSVELVLVVLLLRVVSVLVAEAELLPPAPCSVTLANAMPLTPNATAKAEATRVFFINPPRIKATRTRV